MEAWDVLQCSKPQAKCTLHLIIKVTCISVWLYYISSLLYNTLELQVRMKFGVVTKVSTFLVITQVSSGFKKNRIFSSLANISTFMDSWFSQCKILCHRRFNSLMFGPVVSVTFLLQCLVVTVTAVSSAPRLKSYKSWETFLWSLKCQHF